MTVSSAAVARNDILASLEGDADGADARILSAIKLQIAEACLTGESEAVTTHPHALSGLVSLGDCLNMKFKGTTVDQSWGASALMLDATVEEPTPLQTELDQLGIQIRVMPEQTLHSLGGDKQQPDHRAHDAREYV